MEATEEPQKALTGAAPRHGLRLKSKLALLVSSAVLATALATAFVAVRRETRSLESELRARGVLLARNLATTAADMVLASDSLSLAAMVAEARERNPGVLYAFLTDPSGKILAHSDPERYLGKRFVPGDSFQRPGGFEEVQQSWSSPYGRALDFAAVMAERGTRLKLGESHLGLSPGVLEQARRATLRDVAAASAGILFLALLASFVLVRIATRPLGLLADGARRVGSGDLDHLIPDTTHDEIGELAETFNAMTTDLRQAQEHRVAQERLEQELLVARQIQDGLVPKESPEVPGFQIASLYRSAAVVGGDYLDFVPLSDGRMGLVVADVSGKGAGAAILMTMARSVLRAEAPRFDSPSQTLSAMNRTLFHDLIGNLYITLLYAVLEPSERRLTVANAGHPPLLWLRASSGEVELLNQPPRAFPLGTDPGPSFDKLVGDQVLPLSRGDLVVLYTDGLTEALDAADQAFGHERLAGVARKTARQGVAPFLAALESELSAFVGGRRPSDDIAVIALTVL